MRLAALALSTLAWTASACPFAGNRRAQGLPGGHPPLPFRTSNATLAALHSIASRGRQARGQRREELIREEIRYILDNPDPWNWDDGSWAPIALVSRNRRLVACDFCRFF